MTRVIEVLSELVGGLVIIAALLWFGVKVLEWALRALRCYRVMCEYIWHQKEFKKWLQENCAESRQP